MRREVILPGDSLVIDPGGAVQPGTSDYPWANTPTRELWEVWNNAAPLVGDHGPEYGYCWPGNTPEDIAVGLALPPTLALFNGVTLTAGIDYQQSGPNTWWFPPDNAHGPGATLLLRQRDLVTWLAGTGAATKTFISSDDNNVNISTNPTQNKAYTLTWEMTAHPEGGPWTFQDLADLAVGIRFLFANGPNGKAYEIVAGSFFKIRAHYLTVTLDIEDLGGYVANVRHGSSLTLRLGRRARNVVRPVTLADKAKGDIGSRVYMSHPQGPHVAGQGWGRGPLERRPGIVLVRSLQPESFKIADETFDLEDYRCLLWAAYRIDGPWSPELQGLSLLDKGKGFDHVRAQDAWSQRPGDGVVMRVLEDYPNLSREGLAVSGGGDEAVALRNYDLMQAGWSTVGSGGEFTAAADATVHMAEEQGYLSSARLTYGAGGGTGGRQQTLGTFPRADGDRLHIRVVLKNTSVPDPNTQFGEVVLARIGGGLPDNEYWDEATRSWVTVQANNPIPSGDPFGEVVFDAIPCDAPLASSDPTYLIIVGRFSAAMGPVVLHGALVDVQHTDDAVAGARPSIVTLDAPITRVGDSHKMTNRWGRELWAHERGVAVGEVRPWWRAQDLPDGAVKPIIHAQHDIDTWDALQFVATSPGDDVVRFERAIDGEATFQIDCPLTGLDLTRAHVLRAWARWLGPDGWRDYGPYSVEVGFGVFLVADGSLVAQGSVLGRLTSEVSVPYARDYVGIGCDETRQADAWVRMVETRRNPIHRLEAVWRV